jgi:cell division protein FtsA
MYLGLIKDISVKSEKLVVGLDIGTTKIRAVVGEATLTRGNGERGFDSGLNIIGIGAAPSRGIKKGVVTDIEIMAESIREAVQEAETAAGVDIKAVHIGITGGHIGCLLSHGVIAVKEKEIGQHEVDCVIDAARAVALPFDREMLHVIPAGFSVNGQNGITDPRGMGGVRLETNVHIITCATTAVHNLIKSCHKAGLAVIDVMFHPLASAETILTPDEKDLGVAVIDIGGGTTDIALFHEGNICHASVLALGGNNFTNDVAVGLRIPAHEAEHMKKKYGCALLSMVKDNEEIEVGHGGGINRKIPRTYIVEILQPRSEELCALIRKDIMDKGFHKNMNSGVVLTGGTVLMEGMDVMAENILELPVRIGKSRGVDGAAEYISNPTYSTAVGLALHGAAAEASEQSTHNGSIFSGIRTKMRGWFRGTFR